MCFLSRVHPLSLAFNPLGLITAFVFSAMFFMSAVEDTVNVGDFIEDVCCVEFPGAAVAWGSITSLSTCPVPGRDGGDIPLFVDGPFTETEA